MQAGQASAMWGTTACFRVEAASFAVAAALLLPLACSLKRRQQDPRFPQLAAKPARRVTPGNFHACTLGLPHA